MLKWLHHLLNPHCQDCRQEAREKREEELASKVCQSCESLKTQIETLRYDNQQLLGAIIEKETKSDPVIDTSDLKPIRPRMIPWNQRRQMLESDDRHQAQLLRKKKEEMGTPATTETAELERELNVAGAERQSQASTAQ